jgi:prophage regulatory protein
MLIDIREVRRRVTLSRTSIWRMERLGCFPARRRLSRNRVAWLAEEVDAWVRDRTTCISIQRR